MDYKILTDLVKNLEEEEIAAYIEAFLDSNPTKEEGLYVIKACQDGTAEVGEMFEKGEYFAGDLLVAGKLLKEVKQILEPVTGTIRNDLKSGTISLGTVYGDEQHIGESVFRMLVECAGFELVIPQCEAS